MINHLRDIDRDAYIATLFLPEGKREAVAALWAFSYEVARIRDVVSEPLPGEIRLQWWRDVLNGKRTQEGRQHPTGAALVESIHAYDLPAQAFENLCEARIFDLYSDVMTDVSDLEGYLGETRSVLFHMVVQVLTGTPPFSGDAAGHAGIAFGIAELLKQMALDRMRGQIFIPKQLLLASELLPETFLTLNDPDIVTPTVRELVRLGREHLNKAELAIAELPKEQRLAFVLLGVCQPIFKRAEKRGGAIVLDQFGLSAFTSQWYLTRYAASL